MEAGAALEAAAARVPNSPANDAGCDSVAVLKSKLAAKERDVVEATKTVDELTARVKGLEEVVAALREEKESELANLAAEKDKRITELEKALAAKGRDDDDAGPSTSTDAPASAPASAPAAKPASGRVKQVACKTRHGAKSPLVTSTPLVTSSPINKGKARVRAALRSELAELNASADDREGPAPKKKKKARPSRGRSGRMPSSNERLGYARGKKKVKRDFDVEEYKEPKWSAHAFFVQNEIDSKEELIDFILAYKKRAHRGRFEAKHAAWYPRASKYEAEDFLRLLDNENTEGKYTTHNIASLLEYLGYDEGEDFGKGKGMPYYSRAHRVASLLFAKCGVTSDRATFDLHTSDKDGNKGDAYIFERARKFCSALNTMAMLHDIWTGEIPDVVPWKVGDPLTKPKGKKRTRRASVANDAEPSTKRRPAVFADTDSDDSEEEEADAGARDEDSDEDEDEGEDDTDSSSGEFAPPSEEELAKYAEECLAEGATKDDYWAAVAKWYERYPKGDRNAPKPPWRDNREWGHELPRYGPDDGSAAEPASSATEPAKADADAPNGEDEEVDDW